MAVIICIALAQALEPHVGIGVAQHAADHRLDRGMDFVDGDRTTSAHVLQDASGEFCDLVLRPLRLREFVVEGLRVAVDDLVPQSADFVVGAIQPVGRRFCARSRLDKEIVRRPQAQFGVDEDVYAVLGQGVDLILRADQYPLQGKRSPCPVAIQATDIHSDRQVADRDLAFLELQRLDPRYRAKA